MRALQAPWKAFAVRFAAFLELVEMRARYRARIDRYYHYLWG